MDDVRIPETAEAEAPPGCGGEVCEAPVETVTEAPAEEAPSEAVAETAENLVPA